METHTLGEDRVELDQVKTDHWAGTVVCEPRVTHEKCLAHCWSLRAAVIVVFKGNYKVTYFKKFKWEITGKQLSEINSLLDPHLNFSATIILGDFHLCVCVFCFKLLFFLFFYWSTVDLQCCVTYCCTAKGFSYIFGFLFFFHYGSS